MIHPQVRRFGGRLRQQGRWEGGKRGKKDEDMLASVTCVASVKRPYGRPLMVNPLADVQGRHGAGDKTAGLRDLPFHVLT